MNVQKRNAVFLLLIFGFVLLGVAVSAYWYHLQQWEEIRDLYYAHLKDTAYLLMILGVTCTIASVTLFTHLSFESSRLRVFVLKKCPHCGGILQEDMDFCPYCGKPWEETPAH